MGIREVFDQPMGSNAFPWCGGRVKPVEVAKSARKMASDRQMPAEEKGAFCRTIQ